MGFKSVMKKVGKVALKVAPYAAMAIPGVGIPLGLALQGGLAAADKKISGGSWKDALISGGIGAGLSAVGGKIPGLDKVAGLGTSKAGTFVNSAVGGVNNKIANAGSRGIGSILGNVGKEVGKGVLKNPTGVLGSIAGSRNPSVISDDPMNGGIMGNAAIPQSSFGEAMSAGRNAGYASQPWRVEPQYPIYDPNKRRQLY